MINQQVGVTVAQLGANRHKAEYLR